MIKYSPFSVKNLVHFKPKMSHVTKTDDKNAHQIESRVDRKLFAKFHKDERNVSSWN